MKKPGAFPENYLFSRNDLRGMIIPLLIEQFLAIFVGLADSIRAPSFALPNTRRRVGKKALSGVNAQTP